MSGYRSSCGLPRHALLGVLVVLALSILSLPVQAGQSVGALPAVSSTPPGATTPPTLGLVPIAADRYGWLWTLLENTLNNRARMLQFGLVGAAIALYIMFRARG
jgi:hypothetical protein